MTLRVFFILPHPLMKASFQRAFGKTKNPTCGGAI